MVSSTGPGGETIGFATYEKPLRRIIELIFISSICFFQWAKYKYTMCKSKPEGSVQTSSSCL